jgi:hypothetical protein
LAIFGQLCTISTTSTTFSTTTKQTEYQVFNRKSGGSGGNSNKKNSDDWYAPSSSANHPSHVAAKSPHCFVPETYISHNYLP